VSDGLTVPPEKTVSLADKSLDQLAAELELLPTESEAVSIYHDEIIRRQEQVGLDTATAGLVSDRKRYSISTIIILAAGIVAMVASILLQK
jgi:hypothetical protein